MGSRRSPCRLILAGTLACAWFLQEANGFITLGRSSVVPVVERRSGRAGTWALAAGQPNSRPSSASSGSGSGGDARRKQQDTQPKNRTGRRQEQLDGMAMGGKFELGYDLPPEETPLEEDDTLPIVRTIASAADKRKGEDIFAIRVSSLTIVSSFFVLITGNSRPQIQAIAAAVLEDVQQQHGMEPRNGGEGTADSGWILLDFGSVIVNVMTPTARQYYNLEKLWRKGEVCDLSDVIKPNTPFGSSKPQALPALDDDDEEEEDQKGSEVGGSGQAEPDEIDPFWS